MAEEEPITLFESKGFSTRYSFGQGAPGKHELDLCSNLLQDAASTLVCLKAGLRRTTNLAFGLFAERR